MQKIWFLLLGIVFTYSAYTQGCSDAGGCSAGHMGAMDDDQPGRININYQQTIGLADKQSLVSTSQLAVSHSFFKNTTLELRVPYQVVYGNLGFNSGVGDMIFSVSQKVISNEKFALNAIAAGRLKSNNADAELDGESLPMVYQSSLGTNDIIGGVFVRVKNWGASVAFQHPYGRNENGYVIEDLENTPESKQYYESAKLKRGDDLIFRLQRTLNVKPGNTLTVGTIPIVRLQQSEIEKNGEFVKLDGTKGLTMNFFLNWHKKIDEFRSFSLMGGFPIVDRDYRPDGLTRTFTITAAYQIKLNYPKKPIKAIDGLFSPIEQQN